MKKRNKLISLLLLIAGICALCYGCTEWISRMDDTNHVAHGSDVLTGDIEKPEDITETYSGSNIPDESESVVVSSTETPVTENVTSEVPTATPEPYVSPYAEFFTAYPDCVAWLHIPDTNISYPVMWTPGDEEYYLYRNYDGTDNINGSLLLDTDSSLSPLTTNLIIHGHNMRSGEMFGTLPDYKDKAYYEQHKEMLLFTADCERKYEIIAVFRSQVYKKSDNVFKFYKFFQADTEEEFKEFYENIKKLSIYDTGVTSEFGDHFITLSTCVSHVPTGRFVVVAKEITETTQK